MTDSSNENKAKGELLTFLTFQKEDAEQAMNFYVSLFDNSKVIDIERWGPGMPSKEGTIKYATFQLNGSLYMCSDSPPIHEWDFTPAVSNFVNCSDEAELESLFDRLAENGTVLMPLNNYGFSQKFGFVTDQFGVSWQLNLK
ncbi:VOC family protein [Muricauda sp. DJ-13]|uniref:VOC family protein n=2 Tax=Croceivirga thetidis TaxID=2721623 RepID=A0ABX1GQP9_9FLAO|nr:VOC family protein [Croceivirga thetidis]